MKIFYFADTKSSPNASKRNNGDENTEAPDAFIHTFKLTSDNLAFVVLLVRHLSDGV